MTISEQPGTTVTLSYRSAAFSRCKKKNREKLDAAERIGRDRVMLESNVTAIGERDVELEQHGKKMRLPNDAIIINAGGILPTVFLKGLGIEIETKYGTA